MVPYPFAPPQLPSLGAIHWVSGHLSSIFVHRCLDEIHMQIIWGQSYLRNWILLFISFSSYFLHRCKYMCKSQPGGADIHSSALEMWCWYKQQQPFLGWLEDPLHQAHPRSPASSCRLPSSSGWYPASLYKTFNNPERQPHFVSPITLRAYTPVNIYIFSYCF